MNEAYSNPEFRAAESDELEIDWMGMLAKLLKGWKLILIVSVIFAALGVAAALMQERKYSVSMTLAPEIVQRGSSSSLSSLSSVLGLGGMAMGASTDAMSISLFPEICRSTPFLLDLFPVMLTPFGALEEGDTPASQVSVFDHMTGTDKPQKGVKPWLKKLLGKDEEETDQSVINPSRLTRKQARAVSALRASLSANVDKKTGITTISVVMDDPLMATMLADTVCRRLQEYVIRYRTQKANDDYQYYVKMADEAHEKLVKAQAAYAASVDYDRNVILQSVTSRRERLQQEAALASQIYSQMAQQRELSRAKIQEEKPVFAVVQPATMPQFPMNSRKKTVLLWGFAGLALACAWVALGKDYFGKMHVQVKEKLAQTQ